MNMDRLAKLERDEVQVVRSQRAGQLAAHLDPRAISQLLVMSLQGLLTLVRLGESDLQPGIDATFSLLVRPGEGDSA